MLNRPVPFSAARSRVAAAQPTRSVVCTATVAAPPKKFHPSLLTQAPPSTYAIIEVGGTQLFVEPGKWYNVNRLSADVGSKIKFGRVLALKQGEKLTVGTPYLEHVNVSRASGKISEIVWIGRPGRFWIGSGFS